MGRRWDEQVDDLEPLRDRLGLMSYTDPVETIIWLSDVVDILKRRLAGLDRHDAIGWVFVAALTEDAGNALLDLSEGASHHHWGAYQTRVHSDPVYVAELEGPA